MDFERVLEGVSKRVLRNDALNMFFGVKVSNELRRQTQTFWSISTMMPKILGLPPIMRNTARIA